MLFNSYVFLFCFLPIVLIGYYAIPGGRRQLAFLLAASLFFYAYWSAKLVLLLLFTVVLDFHVAGALAATASPARRRWLLGLSIGANLSILGFCKYYNLVATTVGLPALAIVLPIGISFYTFQSMSYVIDVYRGVSTAHASLLSFAGYVTFFPHQISGPLVRHNTIVPQLESDATYLVRPDNLWAGCCFLAVGLAKKVLVADLLAPVVDPLVANLAIASNLEALLAMLGFTIQLYFDFSGYSDMAVGLGKLLNIQFPQNFHSPYQARSITEFWQRWHISLSSWLRDYLYIPLGGNRGGEARTYRNLLLTMTIGGLWHGASWTFAAWGLFHGLLLATERYFKITPGRIATFALVNLGWIFFRAPDFPTAFLWLRKVLPLGQSTTWDLLCVPDRHRDRFFAALAIGLVTALFTRNTWERTFRPSTRNAVALGVLLALCLTYLGQDSPFLYFQF